MQKMREKIIMPYYKKKEQCEKIKSFILPYKKNKYKKPIYKGLKLYFLLKKG